MFDGSSSPFCQFLVGLSASMREATPRKSGWPFTSSERLRRGLADRDVLRGSSERPRSARTSSSRQDALEFAVGTGRVALRLSAGGGPGPRH